MNIELMEEIATMTNKRSGRSIKWLCEELRKGIADEMEQIDMWYQYENYKQVRRIIKRLRPAQYFCLELKEALDSLEERINATVKEEQINGDSGTDNSAQVKDEAKGRRRTRART